MFSLAELRVQSALLEPPRRAARVPGENERRRPAPPGEYVAHEGETRRALVRPGREGRIEVTKVVAGAERVVGAREPGESFGELPLALNTPFAVSFRATERARVMRVDAKDFQAVAASAPELSARWAGRRWIASAGSKTSRRSTPKRAPYGHRSAMGRRDARAAPVSPSAIPSTSVGLSDGGQAYPHVRLTNGAVPTEPSIRDVAAAAIGLAARDSRRRRRDRRRGTAGLAAAVYGASEGLDDAPREGGAGRTSRHVVAADQTASLVARCRDELAHRPGAGEAASARQASSRVRPTVSIPSRARSGSMEAMSAGPHHRSCHRRSWRQLGSRRSIVRAAAACITGRARSRRRRCRARTSISSAAETLPARLP